MHLSLSIFSLLLLVIFICSTCLTIFASAQQGSDNDLIPTSHPDIYPDEDLNPFTGMVEVTFTPNAPNCDIHYELNTSQFGTSREPDAPDLLLSADKSPLFSGRYPLQITTVGRTKVTAVCIPTIANDLHGKSKPTIHYYTVLPSDIDPPIADPPSGEYVASRDLVVHLKEPLSVGTNPDHLINNARCDIMYSIDDPSPGEQWTTLTGGGGIELADQIGHHVIYAKCVLRISHGNENHKNNGKSSAVVRYTYDVKPPLTYDVGSECRSCNYKPMHGHFFTLVLQGADKGDSFFLTTSNQGCSTQKHILNDDLYPSKGIYRINDARRTFKIVGSESSVNVWVCLRKRGQGSQQQDYQMVPRRKFGKSVSSSTNAYENNFFTIEKSNTESDVNKVTLPPTEHTPAPLPPPTPFNPDKRNKVTSPASSTNFFAIVLGLVLIVATVFVWKIVRGMLKHDRPGSSGRRRTNGGGVNEGQSMVEKKN